VGAGLAITGGVAGTLTIEGETVGEQAVSRSATARSRHLRIDSPYSLTLDSSDATPALAVTDPDHAGRTPPNRAPEPSNPQAKAIELEPAARLRFADEHELLDQHVERSVLERRRGCSGDGCAARLD